jgi:hypothetical protein
MTESQSITFEHSKTCTRKEEERNPDGCTLGLLDDEKPWWFVGHAI